MATEAQILALGTQSGDIFAKASDTEKFYHIPAGGDGGDAVEVASTEQIAAATNVTATIITEAGVRVPYTASADTDAARGVALTNALLAMTSGQTLVCSPGDYYMATLNILLIDSCTYLWNGANLYIDASSTGRVGGEAALAVGLFTTGFAVAPTNVSNVRMIGPLTLDGGSVSGKRGIWTINGTGWLIEGITFRDWVAGGFLAQSSTGRGNRMSNCYFVSNPIGAIWTSAEYWVVSNCHSSTDTLGFDIDAGNLYFSNCTVSFATSVGVKINGNSINEGHGSWVGGSVNHCQGAAIGVQVASNLTLYGFTFSDTCFYSSSFDISGIGIEVNGGQIRDTTFVSSGTQTGVSHFRDVMFYNNTGAEATSLAALTAAKRANIKFINARDSLDALMPFNDAVPAAYVSKTANYTLTGADRTVEVPSGSPTLTLPDATYCAGRPYIIANTGAGTVTMATTSSQTIGGSAPSTVAAGASLKVESNGANWIIIP